MFDLDQYYTPETVAQDIVRSCVSTQPRLCVDSTCGKGHLLVAVANLFDGVSCAGIDKDYKSIRYLRRRYPDWRLSVADLLDESSHWRSRVISGINESDLLMLNPPFSMKRKKKVSVRYKGLEVRSSLAMAHILRSIELFKPSQGAVVVAPESLLFSDVDDVARTLLQDDYEITEIFGLKSSTFKGARANASVIKLNPVNGERKSAFARTLRSGLETILLIRGGLPVHQRKVCEYGIPYVHSTDLVALQKCGTSSLPFRVSPISRGTVEGWVILLPRVGRPSIDSICPYFLETKVQLSDCVIALKGECIEDLNVVNKRIHGDWDNFLQLYRGTGARYVTVSRLNEWLKSY